MREPMRKNESRLLDVLGADVQTLLPDGSTWARSVDPKSYAEPVPGGRTGQAARHQHDLRQLHAGACTISTGAASRRRYFITVLTATSAPAINYESSTPRRSTVTSSLRSNFEQRSALVRVTGKPDHLGDQYPTRSTLTIEDEAGCGAFGVKMRPRAQVGADARPIPAAVRYS